MCRSVDGKADTMISAEELERLRIAERERLEGQVVPEPRGSIYSFLSVACWYFTAFEIDESRVVDAFVEYRTAAASRSGTSSGSHFEQFVSNHLAQLVDRYRPVVDAARENGRTDLDEQIGWKLANELSWRLGGEIGNRGDWRANKLFIHGTIADQTLTPYLGLSRIRGVARSGAIRLPDGEQEFVDEVLRWLTRWEQEPRNRDLLESIAQQRATDLVEQLIGEATALHERSDPDAELDQLPPSRWI